MKPVVQTLSSVVVVAALTLAASVASAQSAFTNRTVKLHAGPDRAYPTVSVIGPGAMVHVNGCLRNFHWCDVSSGALRGWANARSLNYTYGGRPLAIYGNGMRFGLPVVGYVMGSYWDNHYRSQPWYNTHRHNWQPNRPYVAPRAPVQHAPVNGFAPPRHTNHYVAPARPVHVRPQHVVPAQRHAAPVQRHTPPAQRHSAPQSHPQRSHGPQHRP